jgi:hypothetical protein
LFFGGFPALLRGDFRIGLTAIAVGAVAGVFSLFAGWVVVAVILAFTYNRVYTRRLLDRGYIFADTEAINRAACYAFGVPSRTPSAHSKDLHPPSNSRQVIRPRNWRREP